MSSFRDLMIRGKFLWLTLLCLLPLTAHGQGPTCGQVLMTPGTITVGQSSKASGNCTAGTFPIISISIDWGDGGPGSVVPANDPNTPSYSVPHNYTVAGTFTVTVTAIDSISVSGANTGSVTVDPAPTGPTCTPLALNPTSGTAPLTVFANTSCQPGTNPIMTITLDWGDGTMPSTNPAFPASHTYITPRKKPYTVSVTAMDSGGLTATVTGDVTVNAPQPLPPSCVLNLTATSGSVPLALMASGSCSDPQSALTTIVLDWNDGNQTNIPVTNPAQTPFGPIPHTYTSQGTFNPRVTAVDAAGLNGGASKAVTVGPPANLPPSCSLAVSASFGQVPLTVTATANCIDPENDINRVIFSFGDGYYESGSAGQSSATHTYVNAGSFAVQVTATDSGGNVGSFQQTVNPSDNPPLFVAVSSGQVKQFAKDGTPLSPTLTTNLAGSTTGMTQDSMLNLYVTDFTANSVTRFGGHGGLIGNFGSGYNCKPESIVFDSSGNAYVGETGCSHAVLKFDAFGNLVATFAVATQIQGSDWIDLAPDQCTLYYTSQGSTVLRYDVCTNRQLSTFASGLNTGLGLRVLPDNTVLVAEKTDIVRLDASGHIIKTYDAAGHDCWVSVALDSDGTSFWGADYCASDVVRFDIGSGNQRNTINSGTAANTTFGVFTRGPNSSPNPAGPLVGPAQPVAVSAGQAATFNLTFLPSNGNNGTFTFSCANLPLGARCSFSPPSLTGTPGATPVVLTVSTTGTAASLFHPRTLFYALWLPFFGVVLVTAGSPAGERKRRLGFAVIIALLLIGLMFLVSCGGGGSTSSNSSGGSGSGGSNAPPTPGTSTPPGTYTFSVTASSPSSQSSTALILTVQ